MKELEKLEIGDTVYCAIYGKGEVTDLLNRTDTFRYYVVFECGLGNSYTVDGRTYPETNRTLFTKPVKVVYDD
jgi:hypothetical protein